MAEKEAFSLTKLNGQNFSLWKYGVSFLFEAQGLMECLDGTDDLPADGAEDQWRKRQSKAAVILLSSVDQSLHINLVNCTTPKMIWEKLHALYSDATENAKQDSWQKFYEFKITDSERISTQIEKFEFICKKVYDADERISDTAIMTKLLNSLPSRFSAFKMAWECTAKEDRKKDNLIARII
ncbi:hypothetical protein KPH14_000892 [Odynerus spinipes]|uniref:Uncharacterized protein n=1 Tax=Odynerus spinipes TaxID=1348599 RepID=A0AAD9VIZ4_9HYME|nr:hypothetical protein KPH14_000892 [Odynerus spinipes]